METILNKLENFETKLKAMFNGSEELPFGYDLTVEEVEEFKNSFTQEEIQKLNDFDKKLFYEGYKYNFVQGLLALLEKSECENLNKIIKPWVGKSFDVFGRGENIELYWDINHTYQNVNLTSLIRQIKANM